MWFKQDPDVQKARLKAELRRLQEKKGAERAKYEEMKELGRYKSQIQELKGTQQKKEKLKSFFKSLSEGANSLSQGSGSSPKSKRYNQPNMFAMDMGIDTSRRKKTKANDPWSWMR